MTYEIHTGSKSELAIILNNIAEVKRFKIESFILIYIENGLPLFAVIIEIF